MGRGLSDLQRTILRVALANRAREGRDPGPSGGADVYRAEILAEHFGFPILGGRSFLYDVRGEPRRNGEGKLRRSCFGQNFDVQRIGVGRYRSASASLSRALERLERRGLAVRMFGTRALWAGVNLTGRGVEVAREISVNTIQRIAEC